MTARSTAEQLAEHHIRLRSCAAGDHKTTCPQCSHLRKRENQRDPCLSVTIREDGDALWHCHNCGWASGLGREGRKGEPPPPRKPRPILDPPDIMTRPLGGEARDLLHSRYIRPATLREFGIVETDKWFGKLGREVPAIVFPYIEDDRLVNRKYRAIAEKTFAQDKDAKRTLFGADRVRARWRESGHRTLVIVEGEMDVLALAEAGIPAVTMPDGAGTGARKLKALDNSPWTDEAERVVVAGDRDEVGLEARRAIVRRFGPERCFATFWPVNFDTICGDANETLICHGPEVVKECIVKSEPCRNGPVGRVWQVEPDPDERV